MANFISNVAITTTNDYLIALLAPFETVTTSTSTWDNSAPLKIFYRDGGNISWTADQIAASNSAFNSWSLVTNIDFVQTTNEAEADIISVAQTSAEIAEAAGGSTLAFTELPYDLDINGRVAPIEIFYDTETTSFSFLTNGGDGMNTLVHEIGHAIGLAHSHDGVVFPGVDPTNDQSSGTNDQNQHIFTVMGYVTGWTGEPNFGLEFGTATVPMAYDIAAIQQLYGTRAASTGDTTYSLITSNATGTGWQAIWDTGGTDTIDGSSATTALTINLNDAPLDGSVNGGGFVSWVNGIQGGYTIANTVTIENATGGSGNDTITGNEASNTIIGGAGDDTIDGGAGTDFVTYSGLNNTDATISVSGSTVTVTTSSEGTDTLTNVERLSFSNGSVRFDVAEGETAGSVYRLYQAAFARTPDNGGLAFWTNVADNGTSLATISQNFVTSTEFINTYGDNVANSTFVDNLYQNILGRAGEEGGRNFWIGVLDGGNADKAAVLRSFSEGTENVTGVASAIQDGIFITA